MVQDSLASHVIELLHATVPQANGVRHWPIAVEIVAEAQWQPEEINAHQGASAPRQELPLVIESRRPVAGRDAQASEAEIVLMAADSAALILDRQLNIKRFTLKAEELLNILPSDKGKPLTYLADRLGFASLVEDANDVLRSLARAEREIRSAANQWFLTRLLPSHTTDGSVDGVVITFLDITRAKETEEKLRQSQERIETLTKGLEAVVAEQAERVRLLASEVLITEQKVQQSVSRLLHDDLQQVLFSITMQVDMIDKMVPRGELSLKAQLQDLREAANLALHVTRQVAVDLTPPFYVSAEFIESLQWLAAVMKQRHGLEVELQGTVQPGHPPEEVSMLLIQTVRELLFNVVKHANVKEAKVEVFEELGRLLIVVSDHGRGFDEASAMLQPGGSGLFAIRRRLELLGGEFRIESQVGQGTRAMIVVLVEPRATELVPELHHDPAAA
jgi:two-component system, chemotaxis family, CheB/CheR fusion protein